MIHYHGTPITPNAVLQSLAGRNFCVSFARPDQVKHVHWIGQSVMLDNGAFSLWRQGGMPAWNSYFDWAEEWLDFQTTWAVIPDVIDGDADDNDRLLTTWWQRRLERGAPVWHLHEPLSRLQRLAHAYPRVCFGSSGQYATVGSESWNRRVHQAFDTISDPAGRITTWVHMLRGMSLSGTDWPFASVDSTDIARNHNQPRNTAALMAERWDSLQNPARWLPVDQLEMDGVA